MVSKDNGRPEPSALAANIALMREIAESIRRVRGDESYDGKGIRTIWHQGKMATEMLSWEDQKGNIIRQELAFTGIVVMYKQGKPMTTGKLPLDDKQTGGGRPMTDLIKQDPAPVSDTLDMASHLLKNIPDRDYYAQHLLKYINDAVDTLGYDESRTLISDIDSFSKERKEQKRSEPTQKIDLNKKSTNRILAFVLLAVAGVLLGLGAGLLLW
jgi:hypothetical protein